MFKGSLVALITPMRADGTMIDWEDFLAFMREHGAEPDGLEKLLAWVHELRGGGALEDDFSILRIEL